MKKVLIVGGGAAGMVAACAAAEGGHRVILLEKNAKPGRKLALTGNGRCNITNGADVETLLDHVVSNRDFLYSAFYGFTNDDMIRLLAEEGLETKEEDRQRIFPVTDRAADVIRALERRMARLGVEVRTGAAVDRLLLVEDGDDAQVQAEMLDLRGGDKTPGAPAQDAERGPRGREALSAESARAGCDISDSSAGGTLRCGGVVLESGEEVTGDVVLLATGGMSFPGTGSTGDGFRLAQSAGHTVRPPRPALTPFTCGAEWVKGLQGRVFADVELRVEAAGGRTLYAGQGDVLMTHFGISGPAVLAASSYCAGEPAGSLTAVLDFRPDLSRRQLEQALLGAVQQQGKKQIGTLLAGFVPKALVPVLLEHAGVPAGRRAAEMSKAARTALVQEIKETRFKLAGTRGFREAMVTQGGVRVEEVDPVTMASRLTRGLRFAGEVLDLDALTGGYNLQIAWSTGWAAGSTI